MENNWIIRDYKPPHAEMVWIGDDKGQTVAEEVPRDLAPLIAAAPKMYDAMTRFYSKCRRAIVALHETAPSTRLTK